jgi:hypothetical protein
LLNRKTMRVLVLGLLTACVGGGSSADGTYAITRTSAAPCFSTAPSQQQIAVVGSAVTVTYPSTGTFAHGTASDVHVDGTDVQFTLAEYWTDEGVGMRTGMLHYVVQTEGGAMSGQADGTYTGNRVPGGAVETCPMTWMIATN